MIISHNPISMQSNMGQTMLSLFSQFEKEELCQFYIYPTIPNLERCASYYRVTDKEMLAGLFRRGFVGGEIHADESCENQGMFEVQSDRKLYRNPKNKSAIRRLSRDTVWKLGNWYSNELANWLERERPTCIFVAPGAAKFLYDIALRISTEREIPIITYLCDEYYFVKKPGELLDRYRLQLLRQKIEALMAHTAHLVTICEELTQVYQGTFSVEATTLMTGSSFPIAEHPRLVHQPTEINYFGNIRANRYRSLCEIGQELDAINRETGMAYRLNIYTAEQDETILAHFDEIDSIRLMGYISGDLFNRTFLSSQLLLHVEAFDAESIDRVRHSISTKLANSLASGIPLLAYGPDEISSMKYLLRNNCAIAATTKKQLREMLLMGFRYETVRRETAERGLEVAKQFHDAEKVSLQLREIVNRVSADAEAASN